MAFRPTASMSNIAGLTGDYPSVSRAMMVPGGAADGLADLAAAFVNTPIARRKAQMEERRMQLEEARLREMDSDRRLMIQERGREADQRNDTQNRGIDVHQDLGDQSNTTRNRAITQRGDLANAFTPSRAAELHLKAVSQARQLATTPGAGVDEAVYQKDLQALESAMPSELQKMMPEYSGGAAGALASPPPQGGPDTSPASAFAPPDAGAMRAAPAPAMPAQPIAPGSDPLASGFTQGHYTAAANMQPMSSLSGANGSSMVPTNAAQPAPIDPNSDEGVDAQLVKSDPTYAAMRASPTFNWRAAVAGYRRNPQAHGAPPIGQ